LESIVAVKIMFTTDFDVDASGQKIDHKRLNVRTFFLGNNKIQEGFRGLSADEIREIEWNPLNFEGMNRRVLQEYLSSELSIEEYVISASSTFLEDQTINDQISVVRLGKMLQWYYISHVYQAVKCQMIECQYFRLVNVL